MRPLNISPLALDFYVIYRNSVTLFSLMPKLKSLVFWKLAVSRSLNGCYPTLLCHDLWACNLNVSQLCLTAAGWRVSAYSHLLCEDVEPICLCGDRSLFLSYRHLEGHYHYYVGAMFSLICTSHSLPQMSAGFSDASICVFCLTFMLY